MKRVPAVHPGYVVESSRDIPAPIPPPPRAASGVERPARIALALATLCLIVTTLSAYKGRSARSSRSRTTRTAADGAYLAGEGSYFRRADVEREDAARGAQACARPAFELRGGAAACAASHGRGAGPSVVVLALFGSNRGRLDASLARSAAAAGPSVRVLHATGDCDRYDGAIFAHRNITCLPCCRSGGVKREAIERLFYGFEAALAFFPDAEYVLKVEDDTAIDFGALATFAACRPLCDRTLYGNCRRERREPRPRCDGGSGYFLASRFARNLLASRPGVGGPEDAAFSNHVVDSGGRLARACGMGPNPDCRGRADGGGADGRLPSGDAPPPACAPFGRVTTRACSS